MEAEIRERVTFGGGYGEISEDEVDRLVGKTTADRRTAEMDRR
ncbi:hypothetical protein [Bradyrhizobium sp. 150]|nr:hypothetical protein [Bradyrhizobium sp. 150]